MRARRLAPALAAFLALALGTATPASSAPRTNPGPATRWIVRFADRASLDAQAGRVRAASQPGSHRDRRLERVFPGMVATMTPAAAERLRHQRGVVAVEPDRIVHAAGVQANPPRALDRVDQRSPRPTRSYTSTRTGAGVDVYVIDSGINATHTDFTGRLVLGPDYVDASATAPATSLRPDDCFGHGTHVAGIAAGTRHGVAKGATVIPVKVLGCDGAGYESDTVYALEWVLARHVAGRPAVVNLSLSIGASTNVDAAAQRLLDEGVTVTAAAGNNSSDACGFSPGRVPGVLTVANSTTDDRRAVTSNTGRCVDLFAPGTDVVSAWIGSTSAEGIDSGTSMASPFVAGAAALVLQAQPSWSPAQVAAELLGKATPHAVSGAGAGTPNAMLYTLGGVTPGTIEQPGVPTVSGTARVGSRLVANPGTWGTGTVSLRYAWYRVDATGRRTAIPGATGASLVLTSAEAGQRVTVGVTGSKPGYESWSRLATATPVVAS